MTSLSSTDHTSTRAKAGVESVEEYLEAGERRALALGNRGPIRFDAAGNLAAEIRDAYERTGFFVFEGAMDSAELADFDADFSRLLERAPAEEGASVDRLGRPAAGDGRQPQFLWARSLSDPWGGTKLLNGRHPVRMEAARADEATAKKSIFLMLGLYSEMPAALRLSAHPDLLRVAQSLNGPDFVPYNDSVFLKEPGEGAAVAWHQDGTTHWENPNWHPEIHGVNFMAQLCRTTAANGLWVVPGSHREGRIDIADRVSANGGSSRLPDAVPMLCERGDVAVCNRQCLHGSFANASPDRRVTFVWGFFRRDAVLDVEVELPVASEGAAIRRRRYTAEAIQERARLVQLAIDARALHRPQEAPFVYAPTASEASAEARRERTPESLREDLSGYAEGFIFV